ncbi:MAG: repair protein RecO protein [Parcubacteria group bacterium GW2011_GWA1_47_8]|nr:MAG: repair protein RecO protein [Parcubacteria group bacterium GW2011_GWA1_47_8]KKW07974.1 MAG: repair protein RecO protein [Parcubacteria group bacterium GW2011_GWA2_49_16]
MAYHIYHTRGIILHSTPAQETNRFYVILTEELGLTGATAQGVREMKSKLRPVLQEFSCIDLDLVRGKEVWRITSALERNPWGNLRAQHERLVLFARLTSLVRRMVHGEDCDRDLFADMFGVAEFLDSGAVPASLFSALETLGVVRILARLGYLDRGMYEKFMVPGFWNEEILVAFEPFRLPAITKINEVLRSSHL